MHDEAVETSLWIDPATGIVWRVPTGGNQSNMGETMAYEPEGIMPEAERAKGAHSTLPRVVACPPWPLVLDGTPKNIVGPEQQSCAWEMPFPDALTCLCRVAPPWEIAGLNDPSNAIFASSQNLFDGSPVTYHGNPPTEYGPSNSNPFAALTALGALNLPASLFQAIEVLGRFVQGHDDISFEIPFNMPLGQILRVPAAASSLKLYARLISRYTPIINLGGGVFTWLSSDPATRNALFNDPPFSDLTTNVGVANIPTTPVQLQAFMCKGYTQGLPPMRYFFGWVPAASAQNTQFLCPVARGAGTVLLQSDASAVNNDPAAGAGFAGAVFTFNQILFGGAGTPRRQGLNYPPNTTVPLAPDCIAIEVVNVTNGGALPQGVPFNLQYDVGF